MTRPRKSEGSAEAGTSPSHGSNNPYQENAVNEQHDTTARPSAARRLSPAACPVMALVGPLRDARFQVESCSYLSANAETEGRAFEAGVYDSYTSHSVDLELAIRNMISATEAGSLAGAAVQVLEAYRHVEMMEPEFSVFEQKRDFESSRTALYRILFSILDVIRAHCGSDLEDVLDEGFWCDNLNPWATPMDRITSANREV